MRGDADIDAVFALAAKGLTIAEVARRAGVSYACAHRWLAAGEAAVRSTPMRLARADHATSPCTLVETVPTRAYAYLLGQYLGDGSISRVRRVDRLSITTTDDYPGVRAEVAAAVAAVMPGRRVSLVRRKGCADVSCYSTHWTCLFPQHGPGRKHLREIALTPWQRSIAIGDHPGAFLRGLIHSDGTRCINTVKRRGREYSYVRYFFSNRSGDLLALFTDACASAGVETRPNSPCSMSVARRDSVAVLDALVGPKR